MKKLSAILLALSIRLTSDFAAAETADAAATTAGSSDGAAGAGGRPASLCRDQRGGHAELAARCAGHGRGVGGEGCQAAG